MLLTLAGCDGGAVTESAAATVAVAESAAASVAASAAAPVAASASAAAVPAAAASSQDALLALVPAYSASAEPFLRRSIDVGDGTKMNQGNPELARHAQSRSACLAGLADIVLQTPAQRAACGGHENMVPIYEGDASSAKTCIDVFEFPNRACELPFVWAGATQAHAVCKKLGKRLCSDKEWVLACAGDPAGGERRRYAYGDALDLTACNTNKSAKENNVGGACDPSTVKRAYETCSTNTEPSGAYPACRSRFGVFDLHGNVAEAMTRRDPDGKTYSQLKGSAFFYVDVHIPDGGERQKERYVDHCNHDPRWHVEDMSRAWHVNYHLGFRCCLSSGGVHPRPQQTHDGNEM